MTSNSPIATSSPLLKRGFRAKAENTATLVRTRLSLQRWDPLPPRDLAASLGVIVWKPEEVPELDAETLTHLTSSSGDEWSAVTIKIGSKDIIIFNSAHSPARQNSDLMHELAHIVLRHTPATVFISTDSDFGIRSYDPEQEAEAEWLAGCLLLPRAGLFNCQMKKLPPEEIISLYGVSRDLLCYRQNVTGITRQFKGKR